jgi:hypothetical protein
MTGKHRKRLQALALVMVVSASAAPAALAAPINPVGSVDPAGTRDGTNPQYSSVNAITGGSSEPSSSARSQEPGSPYTSVNAIAGPPPERPTVVLAPPTQAAEGFDWGDAALGAAATVATVLIALGGAALLLRRRRGVSPSASTS